LSLLSSALSPHQSVVSSFGNQISDLQRLQYGVLQRLVNQAIDSFMQRNAQLPESRREVCDAETVFLPDAREVAQLFDFVRQQVNSPQWQRIVEQERRHRQQQQVK